MVRGVFNVVFFFGQSKPPYIRDMSQSHQFAKTHTTLLSHPKLMNIIRLGLLGSVWTRILLPLLCFFLFVLADARLIVCDDWKIILLTCWQKNVEVISQDQR